MKNDLVTTEVPCPIPDCGSIVYAPNDSNNVRVDCLDCGAALLTRCGIDGAVTLEVTEDAGGPQDPKPLPLYTWPHLVAFESSDGKEETHG